jgi:hypothetical protein
MPTVNHYFNNYTNSMEQRLIEDLVAESIQIYGVECFYIPRTLVNEDLLFTEDALSKFDNAYQLEMYVKNVDGFEGDGKFLSKFGLEIRDEMTLTVSQRRFSEEVLESTDNTNEPIEGDIIYFPLNKKMFEVKFVDHESIFYQMGSIQTYDLRCEMFEYSHQKIDTGIPAIDKIEEDYSGDKNFYNLKDELGYDLTTENGAAIVLEEYKIENTDSSAINEFLTKQTTNPTTNFVDWSESNPFGDL